MAKYWNYIIKNNELTDYVLEDLGISIPASGQVNLSDQFTFEQISESYDLKQAISDGDLIVNDGTSDITDVTQALYYSTLDTIHDVRKYHYTKTELNTKRAGGDVNFTNISDSPIEIQVDFKILGFYDTAGEPSGSEGQFYVNTDDGNIYRYISSVWTSQGSPSDETRIIDLNNATENIFTYYNSAWNNEGEADDGDLVIVRNDDDDNAAGYVYNDGTSSWDKIFDYDFGTLDDAYDSGGAGAGRIIYVDSKAVEFDATSGTDAPIQLNELSNLPTTNLVGGQLSTKGGILYYYDSTRSKHLSVQRQMLCFGRRGSSKNQYLGFYGGQLASNNSGLRVVRNATIVSLSGQIDASGTCTFEIRKNDGGSSITTLALSAVTGAGDTSINIDLSAGDYLQAYVAATTAVADPMLLVEIAWRE